MAHLHVPLPVSFESDHTLSLNELWDLEAKMHTPPKVTATEEALVRSEAARESGGARIVGDELNFSTGPLRSAAMKAAEQCLRLSLGLKQAVEDEVLDAGELSTALGNIGRCASAGSHLVHHLFQGQGGQEPPFAFHGELSGIKSMAYTRRWQKVNDACKHLPEQAQSVAPSSYSAADLLVHTGACMREIGKACWRSAAHHGATEACAPGLPPAPPPLAGARLRQRRRGRRRLVAAEFLS